MTELPDGKTERIASMRHELASLQRSLLEAQQRITSEVQGRAEDADRLEELETRMREHEAKFSDGTSRLAELTSLNATLKARSESAEQAVEELRRELEARDARIEEVTAKNRELAEKHETHGSSLGDIQAQLAAKDSELAALQTKLDESVAAVGAQTTAVNDLKEKLLDRESALGKLTTDHEALQATKERLDSDLEEAKRAYEAGRGKAQLLANKLASFSTEMLDAIVVTEPRPPRPHASKPPPIPTGRPSRAMAVVGPGEDKVEAIPVVAIEAAKPAAPPLARSVALVAGGLVVGIFVCLAIVKLTADRTPAAREPVEQVAAGSAQGSSSTGNNERATGSVIAMQPEDMRSDAGAAGSGSDSHAASAVSPDARNLGVIVLPPQADGHRVFVDGKRVDPKNSRVEVPCGPHKVQIGSEGATKDLDVLCEGETTIPAPP